MKYNSLEDFIGIQKKLLDLEHTTEVEEQRILYEGRSLKHLENKGICLRNMHINHHKTGLYGRFLVTFSKSSNDKDTKEDDDRNSTNSHRFTSGDIIGVYPNKGENVDEISSGVVSYSRGLTITVAFTEDFDISLCGLYRLMLLTNEVTYKRLKSALEKLSKVSSDAPCVGLIDQLFPCHPAEPPNLQNIEETMYFNDKLDESQKSAIRFVLHSDQKISVIHGPPGTGKTTTVVEVVKQAIKYHSFKVLVCAPSNIAVDNLVERLSNSGMNVVRLGHPARVLSNLQKYSLDAMMTNSDSSGIIKSVRSDISSYIDRCKKSKNKTEVGFWRKEVKELRKELIQRESKAMEEILKNADVILSTANSAARDGPLKHLPERYFDLLIIDEAAQAMEISCWIPILHSPRLILVGDHKQLPPTIVSHKAANDGLAITLLERVVHGIGVNAVCMLTTQYRMHKAIMSWPSKELYANKLIAADNVAKHLLCDLPSVEKTADTCTPLVFVDTAGFDMFESEIEDDLSKGNPSEVEIIRDHVDALIQAGVLPEMIGIITPYNLQVKMLRKCIITEYPKVEIHTVDGFQGREKEAILISMVRSNEKKEIGFLAEDRRMNVALTRARRHLFVVGDSFTVSHHPFLKSMCEYLQSEGDLRSPGQAPSFDVADTTTSETVPFESFIKRPLTTSSQGKSLSVEGKGLRNSKRQPQSNLYIESNGQEDIVVAKDVLQVSCSSDLPPKEVKTEMKETEILQKIQDFIKSDELELEFPSSLSARGRALAHEISEQYGIHHVSCGDGVDRRIVLSKMHISISNAEVVSSNVNNNQEKQKSKSEGHVSCEICSVIVPVANYDLHMIRCKKVKDAADICLKDKEDKLKNAKKSKASKKNKDTKIEKREVEDIDALINSFTNLNSKCNFPKCKKPIKTLGQKCNFCSQMYCLSHHMAEIHGCGDAAKIHARQDIAKYKGNIPHKMNDIKKAQVQNKLSSKLSKLEEQRKKKSKES